MNQRYALTGHAHSSLSQVRKAGHKDKDFSLSNCRAFSMTYLAIFHILFMLESEDIENELHVQYMRLHLRRR